MNQRDDDHWGAEDDEVARRLRDARPRLSAFELDRVKTRVMARAKPSGSKRTSASRRTTPRLSLLVSLLTFGVMVAGTAGTIAAGNSSLSGGAGAAQSQYRPPKCNPRHEECTCPGGSVRKSRDRCICPAGLTFAAGTNDCRCPNGTNASDAGRCVKCPDGGTLTDSGRCVCPNDQKEVDGKCAPTPASTPAALSTPAAVPKATSDTPSAASTAVAAPVTAAAAPTTAGATQSRTRHATHSRKRHSAHARKFHSTHRSNRS
jgi:hypothetical protein